MVGRREGGRRPGSAQRGRGQGERLVDGRGSEARERGGEFEGRGGREGGAILYAEDERVEEEKKRKKKKGQGRGSRGPEVAKRSCYAPGSLPMTPGTRRPRGRWSGTDDAPVMSPSAPSIRETKRKRSEDAVTSRSSPASPVAGVTNSEDTRGGRRSGRPGPGPRGGGANDGGGADDGEGGGGARDGGRGGEKRHMRRPP